MSTRTTPDGWTTTMIVPRSGARSTSITVTVEVAGGSIWAEVDGADGARWLSPEQARGGRVLLCTLDKPGQAPELLRFAVGALTSIVDTWIDMYDGREGACVQSAVDTLIRGHLTQLATNVEPERSGRDEMLSRMQSMVRNGLRDPDLSPATLAAECHVSLRYVYGIFSEAGISPATYIREARLSVAYAMLSDHYYDHLSVTRIAARVGIIDVTSFIRAFRRRYQLTPGQVRQVENRQSQPAPVQTVDALTPAEFESVPA